MLTEQVSVQETATTSAANSEEAKRAAARAKRMANLKMIQPGQCLNPRGRPKKDFDLAALAQQHAEKAVLTLAQCLVDADASWPAKVSAASELLDRGFGRAPQSLDVKHEIGFGEQFEQFVRALTAGRDAKVIEHVENHSNVSREIPSEYPASPAE